MDDEAKVSDATDMADLSAPAQEESPADEVAAEEAEEQPVVFTCGNPRCGYEIASYPCGYCGFHL